MKYGLPYMGSKRRIAQKIVDLLPSAENLYDLFAGGCALTHCAMTQEPAKWHHFHINDIGRAPELFADAVAGKFKNETRFITREMFRAEMAKPSGEQCPYIKYIWSFGNNGRAYLFGKNVEPLKHEAHDYLFANGYDGTAKTRLTLLKKFKAEHGLSGRLELQQLEPVEPVPRFGPLGTI